jgi:hypothetical protein
MNTVDLLVVNAGAPVERFTSGANVGVRRLLELANRDGLYSLAEMDEQLRSGALDISNERPIWAREVLGQIEKTWETHFKRFATIVVVGGGSVLLHDELLRRFGGKAVIPDEPVIATARGLYKYAVMKANKNLTPHPGPFPAASRPAAARTREGEGAETIAFDAGYGAIKVYGRRGAIEMQSAVATNGSRALGKMAGLKTVKRPLHIENGRGSFYVGPGAHQSGRPVESLDFDRLTGSPEMMALFHGAMTKYFGGW